ncbi:arylesterase [Chromatiaceae bacterium AAb-1]|nr:arylesterase [Chromatiaceae bacterium AAb-1]
MRFILILLVGLISPVCTAHTLLILGDSLSAGYGMQQQQGWVHLLQQQLTKEQSPVTLINASISGETTGGALARLPALLKQHQPDTVLVELGGNDGLRGFSPDLINNNLSRIIELIQQHNATAVLMQIRIPPNYGPRYLEKFSAIYPELAQQHQITLWPFFMEQIATNPDLMLPDGIHPNVEAQPEITAIMAKLLQELLEGSQS